MNTRDTSLRTPDDRYARSLLIVEDYLIENYYLIYISNVRCKLGKCCSWRQSGVSIRDRDSISHARKCNKSEESRMIRSPKRYKCTYCTLLIQLVFSIRRTSSRRELIQNSRGTILLGV